MAGAPEGGIRANGSADRSTVDRADPRCTSSSHAHRIHEPGKRAGQAWAQPPTGPVIAPLLGHWEIDLIDSNAPQQFQITRPEVYLTPDKITELVWRNIRVKSRAVNLRRCASTKCKKVGQLVKGVIKGAIVEKRDKWALILSEKGSGWIFAKLIKVLP